MRVGTSLRGFPLSPFLEDHPHACGDKNNIKKYLTAMIGSSPCVWGQAHVARNFRKSLRIIPMRVGTRMSIFEGVFTDGDHPHACGDKRNARRALHSF